jgi:Co/Zn/Cd efflux system component
MSGCCHTDVIFDGASVAYKRVLWLIIALNATMFVVESSAGMLAGSAALQADALDFLGDSVTYTISLYVIGKPLNWRASAAMIKGVSLGAFGLMVFGLTIYRIVVTGMPEPVTMGAIGGLALAVNVLSALLLFKFRNGDANVRSVWLCSRNDAIGNVAVILAAVGVAWSQSPWPDIIVAVIMAALFMKSSVAILRHAREDFNRAAMVS